ncbi:hypothetical protein Tco_0349226 [Tanacetum coccineum]
MKYTTHENCVSLKAKTYDYNTISEELELYKIKKDKLKNKVDTLQSKLDKKLVSEEHIHHVHAEICRKLKVKNQELQRLLAQEEQKTATVKEKLKVAFRKGKYLVQDKRNTLSMILGALAKIDLGVELINNDPFEKMKQIEKVMHDLQVAISSAEQESRKSRTAVELLLAELNEVQERNEDLLEELSKTIMEKDSAEFELLLAELLLAELNEVQERNEDLLEELSKTIMEKDSTEFAKNQLRPGFSKIYNLLDDVLPKDLDYLYNLEASVKSLLESSDTSDAGGQTLNSSHGCIRSRSKSKENERLKPRCAAKARIYIWEKKASDLILASHVSVDDVALAAVKDDDCFGVFTIDQIKEAASGDQREFFLAIANVLKEHKSTPKETLKFLTKYLATFSGEDANAMEEAKEEVVYTIIEFVKSPDMFQVSYYLTRLDHEVVIQFVKTLFFAYLASNVPEKNQQKVTCNVQFFGEII